MKNYFELTERSSCLCLRIFYYIFILLLVIIFLILRLDKIILAKNKSHSTAYCYNIIQYNINSYYLLLLCKYDVSFNGANRFVVSRV